MANAQTPAPAPKPWISEIHAYVPGKSAGKDGRPVTDGVFPESKEFLAGFWIIEVPNAARAYELAAEASAAPGPDGAPLNMAIEVREVQCGPPPEFMP